MRQPLDIYDDFPRYMRKYLQQYGWHFNKKLCEYAVHCMKKKDHSTGKTIRIEPWTKELVKDLLTRKGIELENEQGYDAVYVANMCIADHYKGSIQDEDHMAMFIKECVDDVDAYDGTIMRRWYAGMVASGKIIDWEDYL